jgi:hypothetical protein
MPLIITLQDIFYDKLEEMLNIYSFVFYWLLKIVKHISLLLFQTYSVTDTVDKIAESFGCKPIEGMLSHQVSLYQCL